VVKTQKNLGGKKIRPSTLIKKLVSSLIKTIKILPESVYFPESTYRGTGTINYYCSVTDPDPHHFADLDRHLDPYNFLYLPQNSKIFLITITFCNLKKDKPLFT
jgi:hypothetical protein